ncbi:MAG: nucleotidyltransferase domain-containing protein [Chloroflexota bacterium]
MFEQDRVISRLQQRVLRESTIVACFLGGSHGRRRDDAYSDLDVAFIFEGDASRDLAWPQRREFIQSILPYVPARSFDGAHVRPFFHIALYSNGAKVDYRYESQESLQPNPWDAEIRILKDKNGWVDSFQAQSQALALPQPRISVEELTALDERFWVMFWDILRLLARGDRDKPFTIYLEMLHFTLPTLLHNLPPEDPAHKALMSAQYGPQAAAIRQHMGQLHNAYLAARSAIVRRQQLRFLPNQGFETAVKRLIQRLI